MFSVPLLFFFCCWCLLLESCLLYVFLFSKPAVYMSYSSVILMLDYYRTLLNKVSISKDNPAPYWTAYNTFYLTWLIMHVFYWVPSLYSVHSVHITVEDYSHTWLYCQFLFPFEQTNTSDHVIHRLWIQCHRMGRYCLHHCSWWAVHIHDTDLSYSSSNQL